MSNNSFVFYKSFYDAMLVLNEHDKSDFMTLICNLAFNEVEADFINTSYSDIVKALYTVTAEQIKASIKHKKDGVKGGRPNKENRVFNLNNPPFENTETNVNDNDNVKDNVKVNDNVNETDISSSSFFNIQKLLIDLTSQYGFKINKKSFNKIIGLIECTFANPELAIKQRCEYINAHYPDEPSDSKNALLFKSFKWDFTEIQHPEEHKKEPAPETTEAETNPPPKKCPVCNSKLIKNGLNSVICGHCREQGKLVWWEKENGEWKRQDNESA